MRAAIVTPSVPPETSGQTIVLYHLLRSWDASRYCFITHANYTESGPKASARLPGAIHRIAIWRKLEAGELPPAESEEIPGWTRASLEVDYRAEQIARIAADDHCTVIVATTGDLHDFPAARRAADLIGVPFVPYIFDSFVNQWKGSPIAARFEREALTSAALTIAPNEFTAAEYADRYGVRTAIVRNPVALALTNGHSATASPFEPGLKHLLFTGSIYAANAGALRNVSRAIDRLGRDDVRLHIFSEQIGRLEELGIAGASVIPHAHLPHHMMAALQRRADILVLPLGFDRGLHEVLLTSAPGKTGEYLASGRPILAHVPAGSWVSWYFTTHACGTVVDRDDADAVTEVLRRMLDRPDDAACAAAQRRAQEDFALDRVAPRFEALIEQTAVSARRTPRP
jgi:glycosyltransferase involved in cell wall biosynthesis